ncbi:ribosomal protein S18-alanine N-acetyltransferase [soil metagenome]
MAVLQTIRNLFVPVREDVAPEIVIPAPPTAYEVHILTEKHLKEVLRLNLRCFPKGENYTKYTFNYLLEMPNGLSYRAVTASGDMAAFLFVASDTKGIGHITTIGVAPEHRQRGLAKMLLEKAEKALRERKIFTIVLEVRVGNTTAQNLYKSCGYAITQRINKYYNNGEDCFIMVKSIY